METFELESYGYIHLKIDRTVFNYIFIISDLPFEFTKIRITCYATFVLYDNVVRLIFG